MTTPAKTPPAPALFAAFLGCAMIWGSTFLVISIGNDAMPPLWAAAVRLAIAAPLLMLLALVTRNPLPRGRALSAAVQFGLVNFGLQFALLYTAEKRVPSGLAAVFYATVPLTSTFLTRLFGLERITRIKVAAAAVALVGVAVIFSEQMRVSVPAWPLIELFLAATCGGLSAVLLKRGPRQNPVGANAAAAIAGGLFCLVASLVLREPHPLPRTAAAFLPILYLATMGSIVAFVLFAWLVNHWDVTRISFVSVIVPVVAVILGTIFRHERYTVVTLVGSLLVLAGVLIRIRSDRAAHAAEAIAKTKAETNA